MAGAGPTLSIGWRSALLLLAFVQGLVTAGLLLRRARQRRVVADALLALLLIACCGDLTAHLIGWAGAYDRWPGITFFPFGSSFAVGPLVWLHTRSLVEGGFRLRRRDLLHAIPFVAEKSYYLWAWSHDLAWKDDFNAQVHEPLVVPVERVLEAVVTGLYLGAAVLAYRRYRAWVERTQSDAGLRLHWLQRLQHVAVVGFAMGLALTPADTITPLGFREWFLLYAVLAVLTYYLSITGLLSVPDPAPAAAPAGPAAGEDERPAPGSTDAPAPADPVAAGTNGAPAATSRRSAADLAEWTARVRRVMDEEQPWRQSQLTLGELARRLHTNSSSLSAVINEGFGQNFNDFVNGLRVAEVQARLRAGDGERRGLLAVAFDAGFNAKSTFNRAFRKATGIAPSEYRERDPARSAAHGPESSPIGRRS